MEYKKDFVQIVHNSMHEVIDYFFDDPEMAKKLIKLEKPLCPASFAIYFTLVKKENFTTIAKERTLKFSNFCRKATILLPRMFDMRASLVVPQLKKIMACTRARIDMLGKLLGSPKPNSSSNDYASTERNKLIKVRGEDYRIYSLDALKRRIENKHTRSSYYRELEEKLNLAEDNYIDAYYYNEAKALTFKITKIEDDERVEIARLEENYVAIEEMKAVLDYYAYLYNDVALSPSVVNGKGTNEELFKANQEGVRKEFQLERDYLEDYHQELF